MNETTLIQAKGMEIRTVPRYRTETCVCGEDIRAETGWEAAAVDEHNAGLRHAAWRVWREVPSERGPA